MAISGIDRDRLHEGRIDDLVARLDSDDDSEIDLFVSEYVSETVVKPKAFLPSYDFPQILAHLPYYDIVYVTICPGCIGEKNFDQFKTLVERRAILPTLIAPYSMYPQSVTDLSYALDHINCYEYSAFRFYSIMAESESAVCPHCVGNWSKSAHGIIGRRSGLAEHKSSVNRFLRNIHPFVTPDSYLLDEFKKALKLEDVESIKYIENMSEYIYAIRSAQAFNAPVDLMDFELKEIPGGVASDLDDVINLARNSELAVASGLGLRVPTDVPLNNYIDIVENYRPKISALVNNIIEKSSGIGKYDATSIQKHLMAINAEIDRIQQKRRYMLLQATIDFYGKNAALVNAALVAGAVGLGGTLVGCAGGTAVASSGAGALLSVTGSLVKRRNWIKGGRATDRFVSKLKSDLQPILDKIVAIYVGSTTPAMNVMSLKTGIESASSTTTMKLTS